MKIGVMAQRFALPLTQSLDAASKTGADGVQLYAVSPREDLLAFSPGQRREVRRMCDALGLEIFSICGEVGGFGFREREKNQGKIDRIKRSVDLALALGCRIVTSHIGVIQPHPSPLRENQLTALREIGGFAASCGAVMAVETGPEGGAVLRAFLDELDQPGIAVNLDPGNMVMVPGENPVFSARVLAPYIRHTHIKDGRRMRRCDPEKVYAAFATGGIRRLIAENGRIFEETPVGQGDIDWRSYLAELKKAGGFAFPAVIERETSDNAFPEVCACVRFIREIAAALE